MKREGGGGDGASVMSEKSLLSKPGKLPSSSAPAAVAVDSSSSPNSPPNHIIDSYNKIESFLQNKSELLELWSSNHCQNTAFDHGGAVDGISNMDIVCRGEAPIYDPNFRQRGLNGDIVSNFRQLYDCGLAVKSTFDNHLNKIAKTLHMKSYSWDGYSNEIDDVGLIICPIKPSERATQKIQEKFQKIEPGPPESWLYDLVRASFVCNSENQIAEVCEALQRNFTSIFEVVQIFNHFITPYPSGYRNIVMNIRVKIKNKQGHVINFICEVVIHHVILRKYYVRQRVSEGCYFLSSILLTEERLGHANLVRNDHVFNMLDKLIVEVNHIKLESSQQKSKGSKDLPPSWKEDNIILQCLVALAEVRYQDLQNAPPLFTRKSPPPNSNSPLPPQQTEDYDEEESLIRSWVDILNFFHEYDWAEKYQRLLLIRHLVPKYSEDHAEVAEALDQLASILNHEGKHSMSIQLYEKSIYVKTRIFGERHGLVANTLYTMAEVMTGQGKYAMALPLHEQVLVIRRQVYGNNHATVAQSLESLGKLMEMQNKSEQAKNYYREAVVVYREAYGDNHPVVPDVMNALASLMEKSGHHTEARVLYEQSLGMQLAIFGEYHPSVAASLNNLALCLKKLGEYDEAGQLYARALSIRRKQFGDRHPIVATTLNNLAIQLKKQKKFDEALPYYVEALSIRREVFGEYHEEVAASLNNLAVLHDAMGQRNEALKLHEEALNVRLKLFGPDDLQVADSLNNLGQLYKKLGNIPKAKSMFEQALKIRLLNYGEDHPDVRATQACIAGLSAIDNATVASRSYTSGGASVDEMSLGSRGSKGSKGSGGGQKIEAPETPLTVPATGTITLRIFGRDHFFLAMSLRDIGLKIASEGYINQSKPMLEQSLTLLKMSLHENDEEIARGSTYLADVFKNVGKTSLALRLTQDATRIYRIVLGSCHPQVIQSLMTESTLQSNLSNHDTAKSILGECLSLSQQLYGEDHEEVANVLSALAWAYKYDGDYVYAKRTHERSLVMRMKLFGENHASVASSLSDMGDLMEAQGKYNDALALQEKALVLRQKVFGGDRHREVALSHLSLGKLHQNKDNFEQAKIEFEAAGRILTQISEKDPLLATVYLELGTIRTLSTTDANFDSSIPFFERALDILISRYGRVHADTAEAMHRIACIFSVYPKEKVHERALAILFFEDAYRIRSELYSDEIDNPDVVKSLVQLCNLLVEEELWSKSSIYLQHLLEVRKREYPGEDHVDLCDAYLHNSLVSLRNGDTVKARAQCSKGLSIAVSLFGENDKHTASAYTLLAEINESDGLPNKARKLHEMALRIRQKIYSGPHVSVAESYEAIGQMYLLTLKYEKALHHFEEALRIRKLLPNDPDLDVWIAYTLHDCVKVLLLQQKYEEAKPYAIEGLRLRNILCRNTNSLLVAESLIQLACIYSALGEYDESTPLLLEALEIRLQELGPLALLVAELYHLLGENYQDRGMVPEAEEMYLNALNLHFKVYDEDDSEEAANTYLELALLFHSSEDYDEALNYFFLGLEMLIRLFGLENLQVAKCLSQMAFTLRKAERFDESRKRYEQASAILHNIFQTSEHLEIASVLSSLSSLSYFLKDYEEALKLSKQVYAIRRKLLGHYHVDVISTLANQAQICAKLGEYKEGLDAMMRVYKWRQINLESSDPLILQSILVISDLKRKIGNLEDALTFNDLAIGILNKTAGPQSLELMERYAFAADIKKIQGQYTIAEKLLRKVVFQFTETCGSNHPNTAHYMYLFATLLKKMGKYDEADRLYKLAFQSQIEVYGKDSPIAASTLNNIGVMYVDQDRFQDAEKLFTEALSIRRAAFGSDHPDIAASLNNLAGLYDIRGRYSEAKDLYEESLRMRCRLFGKNHPSVAQSLNNLGNLKCSMGSFEEAQLFYNESLEILRKTYGDTHPDVASAMNNIAGCFESMEQYDRALPLYERSLTIRLNTFGPAHPAVAQSLNNLAGMRYRSGDHQTAINLYEQSMDIKMKLYGAENADVAESLNNIAMMHMEAKKYTSAIHFQRRAVSLLERLFGPDHPHTVNVKGNLGIAYIRSDDKATGEPLLRDALTYLTQHNYPPSHPWMKKFTMELNKLTTVVLSPTSSGRYGATASDSMSISSSDSDARLSSNQKKSNFMLSANATYGVDRYANPGKIKRAPVKVSVQPTPPPPKYHRLSTDGSVVELSDVKLNESDESDFDDNELDLEHIVVDDFLLTEDGSVDVEKAMQIRNTPKITTQTPSSSGTSNRIVMKPAAGTASTPSQSPPRKTSPRSIPLSTPLAGIGVDSSEAVDSSGAGSGNDSSSVRSGRRGNYREPSARMTAEQRLENLSRASNSRQISVNIVDKTTRTRRPSAGSQSDSSTGRSGTLSPTNSDQRIVRPKVHKKPGEAGGYSADSAEESSVSSRANTRGRQV